MRDYELTIVFSPEIAEENLPQAIERVNQFITEKGGTITQVDRWGRRKLAYPINRFMEGNYALTRFKLQPSSVVKLESDLRMSDEILRYLVVRLEE